jgi:hypothetical protein
VAGYLTLESGDTEASIPVNGKAVR